MKHPLQRSMIGKQNFNQNEGHSNNGTILRAHSSEQSPFPPQMTGDGARHVLSGGLLATRQSRSSSADELKADKALIDKEMADRKTKTTTILDILKGNKSSNVYKGNTSQEQDHLLHQSVDSQLSNEDESGLLSGEDSIEQGGGIRKKLNRSRIVSQKTNMLLLDSSGRQYDECSATAEPLNSARPYTDDGNNEQSGYNDALKSEINNLQFQLSLERSKSRPQKLVSGSQFRTLPISNQKCELCTSLEFQLKKSKESSRSLKLQLTRADDALHDMKKNKTSDENPKVKTINLAELDMIKRENNLLIKNNQDLTAEVEKLSKSKHNSLMMTIEEMQKQMDEAERVHREELLKNRKELVIQQTAVKNLNREKDELETYLLKVKDTLSVYKTKFDACDEKLRETNKLLQEVKSKSVDITYTLEINRLKDEAEELGKKNFKLHADLSAVNNELKLTKEKFAIMLKKLEVTDFELKKLSNEYDTVSITVTQLNMRNDDLEKKNSTSISEYSRLKDLLTAEKEEKNQLLAQNNTLKSDINRATARQHDFLRHMTSESENTKKALEKAIASSVRLCVVAPTVNVHVTDKKLKFKANLSEKALRSFILNDVLENYSFLYKQEKEDQSPQGTDLHTWVQYMLTEMQSSIEQHVHAAMDGGN